MWWHDRAEAPHQRSSGLRKERYKRFWTMVLHRDAWNDDRYLLMKTDVLTRDHRTQRFDYVAQEGHNAKMCRNTCSPLVSQSWWVSLHGTHVGIIYITMIKEYTLFVVFCYVQQFRRGNQLVED